MYRLTVGAMIYYAEVMELNEDQHVTLEFETARDTLGRGKHKIAPYDRILKVGCHALQFEFEFPRNLAALAYMGPRQTLRARVTPVFAERCLSYFEDHFIARSEEPQDLTEEEARLRLRNCLGFAATMAGFPSMDHVRTRKHLDRFGRRRRVPHKDMRQGHAVVIGYEYTSRLREEDEHPSALFHGGVILKKSSRRMSDTLMLQVMAIGGQPGISTLSEMVEGSRQIASSIPPQYWRHRVQPRPNQIHAYQLDQYGRLASR